MDLTGFEKMEAGRGKFLKKRSYVISISETNGWIGFGKGLVDAYGLREKKRADIFVKKISDKSFELAFVFSETGQYKLLIGNSCGLSCKALCNKYIGIVGEYRIVGAENGADGLSFLCQKSY